MLMNRQIEIYDLETLLGCFTYTGYNIDTKEVTQFVIMEGRNDYNKLITHLRTLVYQVGFNNVNFDYPILHNLLLNHNKFKEFSGQRLCGRTIKIFLNSFVKQENETTQT